LKTLAKLAAAGEDGMSISPLRNLDRKGGAYVIMLSSFDELWELRYSSERNGQTQTISFEFALCKRYSGGGLVSILPRPITIIIR